MAMVNTIDLTLSGYPSNGFRLPNGNWRWCATYWHPCKTPQMKTVNLVNIETFEQFTYPIIELHIKEKPISWLKKFWWSFWNDDKIYDISIKTVGMKTVTNVTLRSGKTLMADESVDCLKNALDACVWTADFANDV